MKSVLYYSYCEEHDFSSIELLTLNDNYKMLDRNLKIYKDKDFVLDTEMQGLILNSDEIIVDSMPVEMKAYMAQNIADGFITHTINVNNEYMPAIDLHISTLGHAVLGQALMLEYTEVEDIYRELMEYYFNVDDSDIFIDTTYEVLGFEDCDTNIKNPFRILKKYMIIKWIKENVKYIEKQIDMLFIGNFIDAIGYKDYYITFDIENGNRDIILYIFGEEVKNYDESLVYYEIRLNSELELKSMKIGAKDTVTSQIRRRVEDAFLVFHRKVMEMNELWDKTNMMFDILFTLKDLKEKNNSSLLS